MEDLDAQIEREAARQQQADQQITTQQSFDFSTENDNDKNPGKEENQDKDKEQVQDKDKAPKQTPLTEAPSFDINKELEVISEGLFKSKEDFISALPKIKGFDELNQKYLEAAAKAQDDPFADEYERVRNEMKKNGATKEQLKAFENIHDLGDLSKLDPFEARVQKLVLVDGYSEKHARTKVEREFKVGDHSLTEEEEEYYKAELEMASKEDIKALQAKLVQVTTPSQDKILLTAAGKQKLQEALEPVVSDFKRDYLVVGKLNLNGEEGDKAVALPITVDDAARNEIASDIKDYFIENGIPLTQENWNEALSHGVKNFVFDNLQTISQKIWKHAEAHFTKLAAEKYEYGGNLPGSESFSPVSRSLTKAEEKAFKRELLGGELN